MRKLQSLLQLIIAVLIVPAAYGQVVINGSVDGNVGNSQFNTVAGWEHCTDNEGFSNSADVCDIGFPTYNGQTTVTPIPSPDGDTWAGIANDENPLEDECIIGFMEDLTIGSCYELFFYGANFGTGSGNYADGDSVILSVIIDGNETLVGIKRTPEIWFEYNIPFVATAASHSFRLHNRLENGEGRGYCGLDGFDVFEKGFNFDLGLGYDTVICEETFVIELGIEGDYEWQDGSMEDVYIVTESGEYSVAVSNGCEIGRDTFNITLAGANSEIEGPESACPGDTVTLTVVSDGEVDSYEWSTGDNTSSITFVLEDIVDFNVLVSACDEEQFLEWSIDTSACCEEAVAHYSLDACDASEGETAVYAEFEAVQLCDLACSEVISSIVFREPSNSNRHSCTPGVSDAAMCVGSLDDCEYQAGDEKSIVFEITVNPEEGSIVRIESLQFFEKAPLMFDWIDGNSGPNNYPTLYGVRVTKNGDEVFSSADLETSTDWTLEEFNFDDLVAVEECTFRFELLGYCLVGNGADVDAWDIDEISIFASCEDDGNFLGDISGFITTPHQLGLPNNDLILFDMQSEEIELNQTEANGAYVFAKVELGTDYSIIPDSKSDYLNGVSTYDLVQIQKHLLGVKRFESAYELIAADANGSKTVTALDIVELRKLLLGYTESLENVNSWRFVENTAEISVDNAFDFEEIIQIMGMEESEGNHDFTAVKVGDLNGSADVGFNEEVEERDNSSIQIHYNLIQEHGNARIELAVSENIAIEGLQLDLLLSNSSVNRIESEVMDITPNDYRLERDRLRLTKAMEDAVQLSRGQVFAIIHLQEAARNSKLELMSGMNSLNSELYEVSGASREIELRGQDQKNSTSFGQILSTPNPFSENTIIGFDMSAYGDVHFSVQNAEGKPVIQRSLKGISGYQEIQITSAELSNQVGVYYYMISSGDDQKVGKLVLLK